MCERSLLKTNTNIPEDRLFVKNNMALASFQFVSFCVKDARILYVTAKTTKKPGDFSDFRTLTFMRLGNKVNVKPFHSKMGKCVREIFSSNKKREGSAVGSYAD